MSLYFTLEFLVCLVFSLLSPLPDNLYLLSHYILSEWHFTSRHCSFSCVYNVHIHVLLCTYTFRRFPFFSYVFASTLSREHNKIKKDPTKHKNTTDNSKGIKGEKSFSPGISYYFLEFLHCCFSSMLPHCHMHIINLRIML